MTDRKGQVFTYTYDAVDRLTQVQVGTTTFSYTYDATGNRLTLTDGTGTTSFQYDQLDRLTRMTYPDTKFVSYAYDAAGNRTSLTNPGNVSFTYAYNNANRLTQITQGTRIWTFGYDAAGNRASLAHPNGASIAYTYLTNSCLDTITHKRAGGTTFETLTYAYDANGNRTTLTDATGTTTFGYDANNRLTSAGSATYSYDNNGNLTNISTGISLTYDAHNRTSQTSLPGGLVVQYTYDGDGVKIRRIEGSAVTRYYHDGIRPIYETKADGSRNADLERDIFGNLLARRDAAGTRHYYHHDGLGSTVGLTDASGAVAAQRSYDAWGNRRTSSGSAPGNYQFTGAELDPTSGLYHMGARFYDPTVGRWLSEDPVQDKPFEPLTLNFYSYAYSNPLAYLDSDGKIALAIIAGAVIGLGLGLGAYLGSHKGSIAPQDAVKWAVLGALVGASGGLLAGMLGPQIASQAGALGNFAIKSGHQIVEFSISGVTLQAEANVVLQGTTARISGLAIYPKGAPGTVAQVGVRGLLAALRSFLLKLKAAGYEQVIITYVDDATGQTITRVINLTQYE